jgi:hypothetical protein
MTVSPRRHTAAMGEPDAAPQRATAGRGLVGECRGHEKPRQLAAEQNLLCAASKSGQESPDTKRARCMNNLAHARAAPGLTGFMQAGGTHSIPGQMPVASVRFNSSKRACGLLSLGIAPGLAGRQSSQPLLHAAGCGDACSIGATRDCFLQGMVRRRCILAVGRRLP